MTGRIISPDTGNYYVGKGIVSIKLATDADYVDAGNAPEMEVTPKVTTLDHFSSRQGIKKKDAKVVTEQTMALRIVLEEYTARNIALALMGSTAFVWTPTVTPAASNAGDGVLTPDATPNNAKTMNGDYVLVCTDVTTPGSEIFSVTDPQGVLSGNSLTVGVAYTDLFNATLAAGATNFALGDTITLNMSADVTVDVFAQTLIQASIKFTGTNDVGPKWTVELPLCEFATEKALSLIHDGWGSIELDGDVLYDEVTAAWGTATATFN